MFLATIGLVGIAAVWDLDHRICIVPIYLYLILVTSSVDAMAPSFKLLVGIPSLIIVIVSLLGLVALLNFNRFPSQLEATQWQLGRFGGLAVRPVILSVSLNRMHSCRGYDSTNSFPCIHVT
jgi:hypothetical protein